MQNAENVQVQLFSTRGYHMTAIRKIRVPVAVVDRLVQLTRAYEKAGLFGDVCAQIFMNGYTLIEKNVGLERFIEQLYLMRRLKKKGGGGARDD
jgi:hypothetical protein